ncbi:MAG: CoA transferase [Acidimicrobiales bacterium]|jgi:crotonobetainyl-CoA:carnitine CoA-transferase CaiB-like acyl-CoA transferase
MPSTSPGPLHGVRVLDLSSVIMGPLATQILGDLGADVITVEDPRGSLSRVMTAGPVSELSGVALNLLRNKRNVVLDLKDPVDRERILTIAATVDAIVTNLRPGTLGRLRLTYEDVAEVRPDIVFCQAQGYPSDSPEADAPAYDDVIQAGSGIPDTFRRQGGDPVLVPTLVADKVSGLTIAYAVLAALFHRERTGEGQRVEIPMIDVMTAFTLVEHAGAATAVPPQGPPGYPRILNPERQPQRTADGWINVLAYTRENYEDLFREGGRPDLAEDDRIRSARSRIAHADSLYRDVAAILARRTTGEWLAFCAGARIPASAVSTLEDLVDALPEDVHPVAGRYKVIPQPVRFSAFPGPTVRRHAAMSGQHNDEVLAEAADRETTHTARPIRAERTEEDR